MFHVKVYNVPDGVNPETPMDASVFLNGTVFNISYLRYLISHRTLPDPRVQSAIHSPPGVTWVEFADLVFADDNVDPSKSTFMLQT